MVLADIGTGPAILAWIGLALGLVIAVVVVVLFNSIVRAATEIRRYAADILDAGVGIATNLDGVDELARTHQLGGAVPGLATAYFRKIQGPES